MQLVGCLLKEMYSMIDLLVFIIELIIYIPFVIWVIYYFIYAVGYRLPNKKIKVTNEKSYRYLVIFPAYREDAVIAGSVRGFLKQGYPNTHYKVVVVADTLKDNTLLSLHNLQAEVLNPNYTKRSKAAAIKLVMSQSFINDYDAVVVLDADNHVDVDFLSRINEVYAGGNKVIQVRRVAKNQNSDTAYLDGLSEDINNSIFRQGHNNLGFPAALSGSGMAFEREWFQKTIAKIDSVGEDKELEYYLLKDKVYTTYLDDVYVYDEKVNKSSDLSNQRKRWIAAQVDIFLKLSKEFFQLMKDHNWPMLGKLIQWSMPPRILLLAWGPLCILIFCIVLSCSFGKWIIVYSLFLIALLLALPNKYYSKRTFVVLFKLPSILIAILRSFIGLKSARTTFIHTTHGNEEDHSN